MTESESFIHRAIEDNLIKYERAKWQGDRKRAALLLRHSRRWIRDTGIDPRHPGQKDKTRVNDAPMVYAHISF